jgi:hypothetical protein
MSTSEQTIAGSFPPLSKLCFESNPTSSGFIHTYSSRVTRFKDFAALCATSFPVVVEPVKLILSMPGCDVSHGPRLSSPLRHCTTPCGKKRWANSTIFKPLYGVKGLLTVSLEEDELKWQVSYEGFTIIVFPVRTAGALDPRQRLSKLFDPT